MEKYTNSINIKIASLRENNYEGNKLQEKVKYQAEYGTDYRDLTNYAKQYILMTLKIPLKWKDR